MKTKPKLLLASAFLCAFALNAQVRLPIPNAFRSDVQKVVADFQVLAKATGKEVEVKVYEADHGFANPSNPKYDSDATRDANALTLAYLKERLK